MSEKFKELKLDDVRVKGCSHTIGTAAEDAGMSSKLAISLLRVLHYQGNYVLMDGVFRDEVLETALLEERRISNFAFTIEEFVNEGLITKKDSKHYQLTDRYIAVLEEAAELQKNLDLQGFPYSDFRCKDY